MKDYSIEADVNGAERTFHVRAYTWQDAQAQIDLAYKGNLGYNGVIEITEISTLPEKNASPPTPQEPPGVYSRSDELYWSYIREDIRCYSKINPSALSSAFESAQDRGTYTASQLEAIAEVLVDTTSRTAAIQGITA